MPSVLEELIHRVSGFDAMGLLSANAALQLVPENAHKSLRLEAVAHAAAALEPDTNGSNVRDGVLRDLLNSHLLEESEIARLEDPPEGCFTHDIPFFNGPYRILPWNMESSHFNLTHLLRSVFLGPTWISTLKGRIARLAFAGLAVSHEICRRAGLSRVIKSDPRISPLVTVPRRGQLDQLRAAVTFSERELEELLLRNQGGLQDLSPLTIECGSILSELYEIERGPLFQTPIVRARDRYVVALPGHIAGALRHEIIINFKNAMLLPHLASSYLETLWVRVVQVLGWIGIHPSRLDVPGESGISQLKEGIFILDSNKLAYVCLLTDSLSEYDSQDACGHWDHPNLGAKVGQRLRQIDAHFKTLDPRPGREARAHRGRGRSAHQIGEGTRRSVHGRMDHRGKRDRPPSFRTDSHPWN